MRKLPDKSSWDRKASLPKRYLTVKEASEYIGFSRDTIYRLVNSRQIPFIGINLSAVAEGREPKRLHIRFDLTELDKFMSRNAVIPPDDLRWHLPKAH